MSIFDRLDKMTSRAVDRTNSIRFIMTPMKRPPNGRPVQDMDRSVIDKTGIFDYVAVENGIELGVRRTYREGNDLRALQVGREPLLSIDRTAFPELKDEPRQGDVISFPDKVELPNFSVVSSQRDGLSRLSVLLVHEGSQA